MTSLHQIEGDAFAALDRMPECWAHGAVLDAPYLLEFMSRDFDRQHRRRDFEDAFADEIDRLDMRPNRRTGRLSDARRMHVWHFAYFRRLFRVLETTGSRARLLVPFSGVGSEAIGGGLAGWEDIVACETSGSYVAQMACRWAAWGPYSSERAAEVERTGDVRATHAQRGLFEPNPL